VSAVQAAADRAAADVVIAALDTLSADAYSLVKEAMWYWEEGLAQYSEEAAAAIARERHDAWERNRAGTSEPVPEFTLPPRTYRA
jgi:hypothetical protein